MIILFQGGRKALLGHLRTAAKALGLEDASLPAEKLEFFCSELLPITLCLGQPDFDCFDGALPNRSHVRTCLSIAQGLMHMYVGGFSLPLQAPKRRKNQMCATQSLGCAEACVCAHFAKAQVHVVITELAQQQLSLTPKKRASGHLQVCFRI